AASHLQAARIIAAGPLEELEVRLMKLSPRGDRPRAIALDLPRPEARQANLGWHRQEHDQLEPGNERISPATQRPRQDPRAGFEKRTSEEGEGLLREPRHSKWGIRRHPVEVLGIEVAVTVPGGDRGGERGRPAPRRADDVNALGQSRAHLKTWASSSDIAKPPAPIARPRTPRPVYP